MDKLDVLGKCPNCNEKWNFGDSLTAINGLELFLFQSNTDKAKLCKLIPPNISLAYINISKNICTCNKCNNSFDINTKQNLKQKAP